MCSWIKLKEKMLQLYKTKYYNRKHSELNIEANCTIYFAGDHSRETWILRMRVNYKRAKFFAPQKKNFQPHIKEFHTVNHHLRSRTNRAEQERPELTRTRAPLKNILPLSLARLCIIWTSNELSRKVCSRINDRNLAWMVEIRFRSVYNAMVCSQSFQFANHSTKVLTWSRNSVWCAGFMSLAKDKPWNRRKISLIFAQKTAKS